jgi:hypothetical protein
MLSNLPPQDDDANVEDTLRLVIDKMAGGNVARFARRLGLSKSTVWNWVNQNGLPTLRAWLDICRHGGISLGTLMRGDLEGWVPPIEPPQLALGLAPSARKGISSRALDWEDILAQLQTILNAEVPITMVETCRRVGIDAKLLYLRANREARAIAARYREYEIQEKLRRERSLKNKLDEVLTQRFVDGYQGMSARDIRDQLAGTELANVRGLFALVKRAREGPG